MSLVLCVSEPDLAVFFVVRQQEYITVCFRL